MPFEFKIADGVGRAVSLGGQFWSGPIEQGPRSPALFRRHQPASLHYPRLGTARSRHRAGLAVTAPIAIANRAGPPLRGRDGPSHRLRERYRHRLSARWSVRWCDDVMPVGRLSAP